MQLKTKVGVDSSYVVEKTLTLMDEKLLRLIVSFTNLKLTPLKGKLQPKIDPLSRPLV